MSSPIIRAYSEGNEDAAILKALQERTFLPPPEEFEVADPFGGHSKMQQQLPLLVELPGSRSLVLRDFDDLDIAGISDWLDKGVRRRFPKNSYAISTSQSRLLRLDVAAGGRMIVVPVGLRDDADFRQRFSFDGHAMDDYLLRLSANQSVFDATSELAKQEYTFDRVQAKLVEIRSLMEKNEMPIRLSKSLLLHLWAVVGYRASFAAMAKQLTLNSAKSLDEVEFRRNFNPLLDDLAAAVNSLLE